MMSDEYRLAVNFVKLFESPVLLSQPYEGGATDYAYLREYMIREASAYFNVDPSVFLNSSITATTLLRDFVHKLVYFQDDIQSTSASGYGTLVLLNQALPIELDVAPMLRHESWALCGEIAWQFFHICRALGYDVRLINTLNGSLDSFNDGHVVVEVRDFASGKLFIQDPTYNAAHVANTGELLGLGELREIALSHNVDAAVESGRVYTYYYANGSIDNALGEAYVSFISTESLVMPYRSWLGDGTSWQWSDIQQPGKMAISNPDLFVSIVTNAKNDGLSFDQLVENILSIYDAYGVEFYDVEGANGQIVVVRTDDGSYLSINFATLEMALGGVDNHWAVLITGAAAGLPGINYSLPARITASNGVEIQLAPQDFALSIDGAVSPLDFAGPTGQTTLTVEIASGQIVKANKFDIHNAQPWAKWSESRRISDGVITRIDVINHDGTIYQSEFDRDGGESWSQFEQHLNPAAEVTHERYSNDDGSAYVATWDRAEALPWRQKEQLVNPAEEITQEKYSNDDGSAYVATWDRDDALRWRQKEQLVNPAGEITQEKYSNDDGSAYVATWDRDEALPWRQKEQLVNPAGEITQEKYSNDDGSAYVAKWDRDEALPWRQIEQLLNPAGEITQEKYSNDDGSAYVAKWDRDEALPWRQKEQLVNPAGEITREKYSNDDGSAYIARWDRDDALPWRQTEQLLNPDGEITLQKYSNDDGSAYVVRWDRDDVLTWSQIEQLLNPAGEITLEKCSNDDGSAYLAKWDRDDALPWDRKVLKFIDFDEFQFADVFYDAGNHSILEIDILDSNDWDAKESNFDSYGNLQTVNQFFVTDQLYIQAIDYYLFL
jgi:hypothetical protein